MKTNLDTIDRATMAEIFTANCTVCMEVRNSDVCLKVLDLDKRSQPCHKRMLKWLAVKANEMPILNIGDIVETPYQVLVAINPITLIRPATKERLLLCDIDEIKKYGVLTTKGNIRLYGRLKMARNKKFSMMLSLDEYYAIRHALELKGDEKNLLTRINNKIYKLHKYFDGHYHRHQCLDGLENQC